MDYEGLYQDLRMMRLRAGINSTNAALDQDMRRSFEIFEFEKECQAFISELYLRGYGS